MIDLNNYLEFKITTALESGSRTINPEENCPPTLKLTLNLTQTLNLTGGDFPWGQLFGYLRIETFLRTASLK